MKFYLRTLAAIALSMALWAFVLILLTTVVRYVASLLL